MANEKTQQNLISGIEHFDATKLKHAQTQEKNPLPDANGKCICRAPSRLFHSIEFLIFLFLSFDHRNSHRTREGEVELHQWN